MRLILSFLLTLSAAAAAELTGPWHFTYTTPSGVNREGALNLKVDGGQVTGTVVGNRGTAKIEDGHVEGDNVSFRLIRHSIYDDIEVRYEGKVENGVLKLKMRHGTHAPIAITATRSS